MVYIILGLLLRSQVPQVQAPVRLFRVDLPGLQPFASKYHRYLYFLNQPPKNSINFSLHGQIPSKANPFRALPSLHISVPSNL